MSSEPGLSQRLAEFVAGTRFEDLPSKVVHQAKRCVLDFVGLAVGAHAAPEVQAAGRVLGELGGAEQATILGSGRPASLTTAATLDGMAAHLDDFDDSYLPALHHPTTPTMAAAMPLAAWLGRSGRDVLLAHVVGFETSAHLGLAACPAPAAPFWFTTGLLGSVGASAAAASLLGLDAERALWALGGGAGQAAGIREHHGSAWKSLQAGRAGANGVLAGLLARGGLAASPVPFEGNRGFLKAFGIAPNPPALVEGLGEHWEVLRDSFKPYACGVVAHPIIDAMRRFRQQGLRPDQVESIRLRVHPYVVAATGKPEPHTALEGKFSVAYCAAIGLIEGAAGPPQFTDEKVLDPEPVELRRKVELEVDQGLHRHETLAEVRTLDGRTLREHVERASGTDENPLSDADLEAKHLNMVTPVLGAERARRLADLIWRLDEVEEVGEVVRASLG